MTKWNIDPDHSVAAFKVRHLTIANVRGQFNKLKGFVRFNPDDPAAFSLDMTIDTGDIYTGIAKRDAHLRSPDFFDVATYPTITFISTEFIASDTGGTLTGNLTIHGITQPVTLEVIFSGPVVSPADLGGETTLGITAKTAINREEFDMTWNVPINDAGMMIGKDIEIDLNIEADMEE